MAIPNFKHSLLLDSLEEVPEYSPLNKSSFILIDRKCIHNLKLLCGEEIKSCTLLLEGFTTYENEEGEIVGQRVNNFLLY